MNAAHARILEVRRLLLIGHLDEAERTLAGLDPAPFPPASRVAHELVVAGIAVRRLRTRAARAALARAEHAAREAGIPALIGGGRKRTRVLDTPAARPDRAGRGAPAAARGGRSAAGLEARWCRRLPPCRAAGAARWSRWPGARCCSRLPRALGEAWPGDVSRDALLARAFGARHADESHRARLRVEIGRLRARAAERWPTCSATKRGFALVPRAAREVVVLARPVEERHAAVLAFLADGESWSSSALALALGTSQRTVQRALDSLAAARQGAVVRSRSRAPLDDPAHAGIHDDLVTPGAAAG